MNRGAGLPNERTIKGKRHIVALIVICDECGNREVGWAWRDRWGGLRYDGEIEPSPNLGYRALVTSEEQAKQYEGEPIELVRKRPGERAAGPITERSLVAHLTDHDRYLFAYCPRHGAVITREPLDIGTIPVGSTRRVRAYHTDGE